MVTQRVKSNAVEIHGLRELNRALRSVGPELRKEFKTATKAIAGFVSQDARALAYSQGGVAARVAPTLRPVAGATGNAFGAGVSFGGANHPEAMGAEFGSVRYKQFEPWRGSDSSAGYFLYPAIRKDSTQIVEEFEKAADRLLNREFPIKTL